MASVDLYDSSYGHYALTAYGEIRRETYGEDYGQTSWVTTAESNEIPKLLRLCDKPSVLEIGCGSGGYAVYLAMYFFSPPGENERLIKQAGFKLLEARDTTESAAMLSQRWHDAREKRKSELVATETEANFLGLQRFLTCVHSLTSERRLLRFLYVMEK